MTEHERFLSLFRQEVLHTFDYLRAIDESQWQGVPADSSVLFLGERVQKITIASLARHLASAESQWIRALPGLPEGAPLPMPQPDPALAAVKTVPSFLALYEERHRQNMEHLRALTPRDLEKALVFAGRHYTGMGFLWSILGHHAYHLGQIDLLMRQQEVPAPEYMDWEETEQVLG